MKVLVIEDDAQKYGQVFSTLCAAGVSAADITHVIASVDACEKMAEQRFDLALLDINIPRRLGEAAVRGEGLNLLRTVRRDASLHRPRYVVALTAFPDIAEEFGQEFAENLWSIALYSENSDLWKLQISAKVEYISAVKKSDNFRDGKTYGIDAAIICALEDVELNAVRQIDLGWQPLKSDYDETRYLVGTLQGGKRPYTIVLAAPPRMGMPHSAVLASKMIALFRPKVLAMTGICAGRSKKVNIGDIIVADPTWDWGSGKIETLKKRAQFLPSPHHLELDTDIRPILKPLTKDVGFLAEIRNASPGPKPTNELKAHIGPLASGAAVVAHKPTFDRLIKQHRSLLGIEMEAYAVACAGVGSGKPRPQTLVIKSVCDFADKEKADDFQEYAASTSARFTVRALREILDG